MAAERKPLLFENLSPSRLAAMWVVTALIVIGAVAGSLGMRSWARAPADFVLVCGDSVPPIPPPQAGLAARFAALDSMVACTERMEEQYIAKGDRAFDASLGLLALAALAICVSAVATRRVFGVRTRAVSLPGRGRDPAPP